MLYKKRLKLLKGIRDHLSVQQYNEAAKALTEVYSQQEVFWRQRLKQLWLREVDSNSKYFHSSTKVRRKKNLIASLHNSEGDLGRWP